MPAPSAAEQAHNFGNVGKTVKKGGVLLKILLLTNKMDVGGAETHVAQLALKLARSGNDEVCVASAGGRIADALESVGIRQLRLPLCSHNPFCWLLLRRKLRTLIKKEDFQVAHAHARIPALLIRGVRQFGCAEIVTMHAKFRSGPLFRLLSYWGEHTVAVSEDLRTYLQSTYRVPAQRISVIENGIDLSRFYPRERLSESKESLHILFASRLDADCSLGAELLCEIAPLLAKRAPNVRITLAGGGQKLPQIAQRIEKINREIGYECLTACGSVDDMPGLMREHEIFVGVSRAALEAAACGCAVILCGNEGYGGILDGPCFAHAALTNLCARGKELPTAPQLLQDLTKLISSPEQRQRISKECLQILNQEYDAAKMCQKTRNIYQNHLHVSKKATLAVGGYFGCGNLGDDAILQAFISYIRSHYPDIRILALTGNPRKDRHRFGVPCFGRKNPVGILRALCRADFFLCGGGSLLQNVTGKLSLSYYLFMLHLARLCGGSPILYAAGIGPLHGKNAKGRTQKVLRRCAYISLRDEESLQLLLSLGVDRACLHMGADAALLLSPPPKTRALACLMQAGIPTKTRYVCVSLKAGNHTNESCRIIVAALRMLCRQQNLLPVFLPLDVGDRAINAEATERLGGKMILADEPSDIPALLSRAELLISMRLHALIFATEAAIPAIGIPTANDQKIPSFARISGEEYLLPEELTAASLLQKCEKLLAMRNSLEPILTDACRDLQKNARKDLANILTMVYNSNRYAKKSEDMT